MGGTTPATHPFCCHLYHPCDFKAFCHPEQSEGSREHPLWLFAEIRINIFRPNSFSKTSRSFSKTLRRFGPNIEEFLWHGERSGCTTSATLCYLINSTLPPWWHEWHHLGQILREIRVFSLSLSLELNFKRHEDPILPFLAPVFSNLWGM